MDSRDTQHDVKTFPAIGFVIGPFDQWQQVTTIEPRIQRIIDHAAQYCGPKWRRYESAKAQLSRLVGWHARDSRLSSSKCYEQAIHKLCQALNRRRRR